MSAARSRELSVSTRLSMVAMKEASGWIEPESDTRVQQKPRIGALGGKPTRVYVFTEKMWEED